MAIRGAEYKPVFHRRSWDGFTLILMIAIAAASAMSRADKLTFQDSDIGIQTLKAIAVLVDDGRRHHKYIKWQARIRNGGNRRTTPLIMVNVPG